MKEVSIIIVNYNVCDLLLNCIASLRCALVGIDSEIIVVDNASSDMAVGLLNSNQPDIITISLKENLGFGKANNIGIKQATGKYILLLNPDTIVQEDTIQKMILSLEQTANSVMIGCKVMTPDGKIDVACRRGFPTPLASFARLFGLTKLFPNSKALGGYNLSYLDYNTKSVVDAISGCFMFCKSDVLKKLNGFDDDFFMYGEDLDLCFRAKKYGDVVYDPSTSIIHIKGVSTRRSSIDRLFVFYDAMEIFARKHFGQNKILLFLLRLGIKFRRTLAQFDEKFPLWQFYILDLIAIMVGFALGTIIKFSNIFYYPAYAVPWVYIIPPIIFGLSLALSGAYRKDRTIVERSVLGYMLGFFMLSALPYFFKNYAFSRGVIIISTFSGLFFGAIGRFLFLLYDRIWGKDAIKRIAFLSKNLVENEIKDNAQSMFLGRAVSILGTIYLTQSEFDKNRLLDGIGTIDNIGQAIKDNNISDIFIIDKELNYSEVLLAMQRSSKLNTRFHVYNTPNIVDNYSEKKYRLGISKLIRDKFLAIMFLCFYPLYYCVKYMRSRVKNYNGNLKSKNYYSKTLKNLFSKNKLVAPTYKQQVGNNAVFVASDISNITNEENLVRLEEFYNNNSSLLLDSEIILVLVREQRLKQKVT